MKLILVFIFSFLLFSKIEGQNISGNWQGNLYVSGNVIPIIFHIKKDTSKYVAVFDSPTQKAFGIACNDVSVNNDSITISIQIISGFYSARFINRDSISGMWHQGKAALPLNLSRTSDTSTYVEHIRPQTPVPPFPYLSIDTVYTNFNGSMHYGATLTRPFTGDKFPAVILITGSGKQDRDENIFGHKSFEVIADYLTKKGIAVLRVDDRGMNKTSGDFDTSTTEDFAKDVEAGIDFLKTRNDIDIKNIGLIGHSEGGVIAPFVAAEDKDVSFIILLAGTGVKGIKINDFQNIFPMQQAGINETAIKDFLILHHHLINIAINSKNPVAYDSAISKAYLDWKKDQTKETLNELFKTSDEKIINSFKHNYVAFKTPWWKFFLNYDPAIALQKLSIPVLAINGEKDIQVPTDLNLPAIESALKKSKSKDFKIMEIPGLNHLFQHCSRCTIDEYADLDETFAPEVLKIMADWIAGVIKNK